MTYRLLPDDIKIIGITGTNGKTTTPTVKITIPIITYSFFIFSASLKIF